MTAGDEELAAGADDELPVLPVLPELSVEPVLSVEELLPLELEVPSDPEEVDPDVAADRDVLLAPGCTWATTIPMAAVAPVAARTAPRVRWRTRDRAFSLFSGVFARPLGDMSLEDLSSGDVFIPPCSNRHGRKARCGSPVTFLPSPPAPNPRGPAPAARAGPRGRGKERMPQVNTVRGPVGGDLLGRTLMHEHILVLSPEIEKPAGEWDEAAERARAVTKLRELKEHGIDTLVDLTVVGLGRHIPRVAAIAEQVPEINVVVANGVYTIAAPRMRRPSVRIAEVGLRRAVRERDAAFEVPRRRSERPRRRSARSR
ncbi:MAG: hypothetical protein ACLPYY_19095 [Acidimicrobiales bacterium]